MFGGAKLIWIQPAGEEIVPAVDALLAASATENPVVAITGRLGKTSALLKLAESHALALAHISYELDARDAERLVEQLARTEGLRPQPGVAARIAESCANDRRMMAQELAKIALYLNASPVSPKDLGLEALDAVGADMGGDFLGIADLALTGDIRSVADALSRHRFERERGDPDHSLASATAADARSDPLSHRRRRAAASRHDVTRQVSVLEGQAYSGEDAGDVGFG